jgi:YHS domain-containing protein
MKGKKEYKLEYMGADWYFSSKGNLEKFKADPKKFAPQYGGYCAWAIAEKKSFASGDPMQWSIVDGKLYLNYNRDIQNQWLEDVPGFIAKGDLNWPMLFQKNKLNNE